MQQLPFGNDLEFAAGRTQIGGPPKSVFHKRRTCPVMGVPIDSLSFDAAQDCVLEWAGRRESRYVVLANAHVVATASRDENFRKVLIGADMATPDGAPVAWMLRQLGHANQQRVSGPDLMWSLLRRCAHEGMSVYFYGGTPDALQKLTLHATKAFPGLCIAGAESPPFRSLSPEEDADVVQRINASGTGLLFVGLGCPKQEHWMAEHRGKVRAVMLGVGAAFDFHAGHVARAPNWMQHHGLEWVHRLWQEPRRLWKRYLVTNTLFVLGTARQLLGW